MFASAINVAFTVQDLLLALLVIAGIVALVFLTKLFMSIAKITDNIGSVLKDNKEHLNATLENLPNITNNVNNTITNANRLINGIEPSVVSTLQDVSNVTSQLSNVTTNISDTVEVVGLSVADTASKFTSSFSSATDKFTLFRGILGLLFRK